MPFPLGEGFTGWPWLLAGAADESECCVADFSERLRSRTGPDPAGVLSICHVAHVEQGILDLPMIARKLEHSRGLDLSGRQARDGVDNFARAIGLHLAAAFDAADGRESWPVLIEAGRQFGPHRNLPGFDAAMGLFDGPGAFEIGRITPPGRHPRNGGDYPRRGEYRRRRERVRIAVPADWL